MRVVVCGKGGVGKTTVAALLARIWARRGHPVVAIDADPAPNLAIALGLGVQAAADLDGAVNAVYRPQADTTSGNGDGGVEALLARLGVPAPDGVTVMATGRIERPTHGCLCCGSHNMTRQVLSGLDHSRRTLVADLEPGMNALRWADPGRDDVLVVVTEPSRKALEVTARMTAAARTLGVARTVVLANRVHAPRDRDRIQAAVGSLPVFAVPDDLAVHTASRVGRCLLDTAPSAPAARALHAVADRLLADRRACG